MNVVKTDRYRAPALDKGLDILELLSAQPGGLTRAEIVKAMGRQPSEVYRMLERLVARDYVARSREGDRYMLTMKLFILANRHPPLRRLVGQAQPLMDAFAIETRQSCHLVVPDGETAVVVGHASSPGNWEFGIRIGAVLDLLATGSGQMLLASMDETRLAELARLWEGTARAGAYAGLAPALAEIARAGYRIGPSQQLRGVEDITVPVLFGESRAVAVITCPYIHRVEEEPTEQARVVEALQEMAERLSMA